MNKIAIIADIHANRFALDAVIDALDSHRVDEVIVAGDMVGRGPQGSAVVERIDDLDWAALRGNHEDYLLSFCLDDIPDPWHHEEQWAASRWMAHELSSRAQRFIDTLPFSINSSIDPNICVFHGSPNSHSEGIGPWTGEQRLNHYLHQIDGSLLVCAHTHRPLHYQNEGGTIINVGSVGLPFNGDWRAQFVILTGEPGQWEPSFHKVEYDRQAFLDHYSSSGFLDQGKVTAQLLYLEVRHARPFLVPFLKWSEKTGRPPQKSSLDAFLEIYDPNQSMREFFNSLSS